MKVVLKARILLEEMLITQEYGPGASRESGDWFSTGDVIMFDASPLARRLAPEISLHFSNVGTASRRLHKLEYVVFGGFGHCRATVTEVSDWIENNALQLEQEMLDEAISVLWNLTESMEASKRQPAYRGLTVLRKEVKALTP